MNQDFFHSPIGTPGKAWLLAEVLEWRARQHKQRSFAEEVLTEIERLKEKFEVMSYGEVVYESERFPLMAIRNKDWQPGLPNALVTGGVHGYETSGVHGALRFLNERAHAYAGKVNFLVVPCVSPWAYERIHRWNFDAIDPNRSFRPDSSVQESAALMSLVASVQGGFLVHVDLHETTDTDESEFRPALAARDGKPFEPCTIPDGFYLVDDVENPQPDFQRAIIEAVERVTHVAPADEHGGIIGSPLFAHGVIRYPLSALGLCAGITGARYTTTTEVYPDSPQSTPEICNAAQAAAVCAALDFLIKQPEP